MADYTAYSAKGDLYVSNCPRCGVLYAVTRDYEMRRRHDGAPFYCPNGHTMSFGDTEADKMRRERDRAVQENARLQERAQVLRNEVAAAERSASAFKGRVTRLKNRAAAGVCPCCNRSFENLRRHMASQHKDFAVEPST